MSTEAPLALPLLTARERREYEAYMKLNQQPMSVATQARFYTLFVNGVSCEEIVRLNPGSFPLGAIVRARIEFEWDKHAEAHRNELFNRIRERVIQVQFETASRLANEIAASNKLVNDRLLRFLQNGEEEELKDLGIGGARHLHSSITLLQQLSGQKPTTVPQIIPEVPPEKNVTPEAKVEVLPSNKPVTPEAAASALRTVTIRRKGEGK